MLESQKGDLRKPDIRHPAISVRRVTIEYERNTMPWVPGIYILNVTVDDGEIIEDGEYFFTATGYGYL
jgi:hypothetical protein